MADLARGLTLENLIMLYILLRPTVDKMLQLKTFVRDLDCKPLRMLYGTT